jgi:glycosyltransferase involved in cell wall biosynthesis
MEISIVFPAKDEAKFIKKSISIAKKVPGVKEIIVVDGMSSDGTPEIASKSGARVIYQSLLKYPGKGVAMRDGYYFSKGDIIAFLDADIKNLSVDFVEKLIEPLRKGEADFVKGTFGRASGRVTELVAKPLLRMFYPELAKLSQPLSGEIAGTRKAFSVVEWELGWGVDIGIVIDIHKAGLRIIERNLGYKDHDMKPLPMLTEMAFEVAETILRKAERDGKLSRVEEEEMLSNMRKELGEVESK